MPSDRLRRVGVHRAVQRRYRPDRRQFERLVAQALAGVPDEFRRRLENVAVVVEEWPPDRSRRTGGSTGGQMLLGLYEGTPLPQRDNYHLAPPDRISIFRGPILAICSTRNEVLREIRDTVIHELGHYFGLDEHELR